MVNQSILLMKLYKNLVRRSQVKKTAKLGEKAEELFAWFWAVNAWVHRCFADRKQAEMFIER